MRNNVRNVLCIFGWIYLPSTEAHPLEYGLWPFIRRMPLRICSYIYSWICIYFIFFFARTFFSVLLYFGCSTPLVRMLFRPLQRTQGWFDVDDLWYTRVLWQNHWPIYFICWLKINTSNARNGATWNTM